MAVASRNTCLHTVGIFSCGVDALLDTIYHGFGEEVISSSTHNNFAEILKIYCVQRRQFHYNIDAVQQLRELPWDYLVNNVASFRPKGTNKAVLSDALPLLQLSALRGQGQSACPHCTNVNVHRNTHVNIVNAVLFNPAIAGNLERATKSIQTIRCAACNKSYPRKQMPLVLCVHHAFGGGRSEGVRVSEVVKIGDVTYSLCSVIRHTPGHFIGFSRFNNFWFDLNDLATTNQLQPKRRETLNALFGRNSCVEFTTQSTDRIMVYFYRKCAPQWIPSNLTIHAEQNKFCQEQAKTASPRRSSTASDATDATTSNKGKKSPTVSKQRTDGTVPKARAGQEYVATDVAKLHVNDIERNERKVPVSDLKQVCPALYERVVKRGVQQALVSKYRDIEVVKVGAKNYLSFKDYSTIIMGISGEQLTPEGVKLKESLLKRTYGGKGRPSDKFLPASELYQEMHTNSDHKLLLEARANQLSADLKAMSISVGHGKKKDLKALLKYMVHHSAEGGATQALSLQDLLEVCADDGNSECVLTCSQWLYGVENFSDREMLHSFRGKMAPLLPTPGELADFRKKTREEFIALMYPSRYEEEEAKQNLGWRIRPEGLYTALRHLYYFLPEEELWRLYGDARKYGRQKTTIVSMSCINDEMHLNGLKFHNPADMFCIAIWFGGDSREGLEENVGDAATGGPGWLNEFVRDLKKKGHRAFLTGDSNFLDCMLAADGELNATSKTGFNMYNKTPWGEKGNFDPESGRRSTLNVPTLDRDHPNSLLPELQAKYGDVVSCFDHGLTRTVERFLIRIVKDIILIPSLVGGARGHELRKAGITHLTSNLRALGVKSGNFQFNIDDQWNLDEEISLNKSDALSIVRSHLAKTIPGSEHIPSIMDNVSLDRFCERPIDEYVASALNLPAGTKQVKQYQLESEIFRLLGDMYEIIRREKIFRPRNERKVGSQNLEDYEFYAIDVDRLEYIQYADLFHRLICLRFGQDALTGYMMKFIDCVPSLMQKLPCPLMRYVTEGNEASHYVHMRHFYQHTPRGGGSAHADTLLMLMEWQYRNLRHRLLQYSLSSDEMKRSCGSKFLKLAEEKRNSAVKAAKLIQRRYRLYREQKAELGIPMKEKKKKGHSLGISRKRFFIVGRLTGTTQEAVAVQVRELGGRVIKKLPPNDVKMENLVVICEQAELDKAKPIESVITAFRRKWLFVSPQYIRDASESNSPTISMLDYLLELTKLESTPQSSRIQASADDLEKRYFGKTARFHTVYKKHLRKMEAERVGVTDPLRQAAKFAARKNKRKYLSPRKAPKGYCVFGFFKKANYGKVAKLTPSPATDRKVIQERLSRMWKSMSPGERKEYGRRAREDHRERVETSKRLSDAFLLLSPKKPAANILGLKLLHEMDES